MTITTDRRLYELEWVAMDVEATGVAWGHDRIIELAAVRFEVDRAGKIAPGPRFNTLVHPERPIPTVISRITGLVDADVAAAPRLSEIWNDLEDFLRGRVVIAHGVRSDLKWLAAEALRLGKAPIAAEFQCTLELARRCLHGAPRFTLPALVAHLGLGGEEPAFHRAMADALHTRNLFARCVQVTNAATAADLGLGPRDQVPWPGEDTYRVQIPLRLAGLDPLIGVEERCDIVYRGGSAGRAPRPVTPLGWYAQDGVTYLRAWCHLTDLAKSFRADRIESWRASSDP